jgi:uncharacterized membrane protein YtjA (UPF0391 family)
MSSAVICFVVAVLAILLGYGAIAATLATDSRARIS